jgi:uncharacterized membrane protein YecN with MAPEG domain
MTIPVWMLLGFAGWTLIILLTTVGVYRWSRIVTGRAAIYEFRAGVPHEKDWYRRAMRAHANCVENLPVYGAIVLALVVSNLDSITLDVLALILMASRVVQTITHISFEETTMAVSVRFTFFIIQLICMFWMGIYVAVSVL